MAGRFKLLIAAPSEVAANTAPLDVEESEIVVALATVVGLPNWSSISIVNACDADVPAVTLKVLEITDNFDATPPAIISTCVPLVVDVDEVVIVGEPAFVSA